MPSWAKYTLVTIALSALGYFVGSITYALIILSMWWGGVMDVIILIGIALFLLFAISYLTVFFNILWWYPAAVLNIPGTIWIIAVILFPKARPPSFHEVITWLLTIFLMVLVELSGGILGLKQRRIKDAERVH